MKTTTDRQQGTLLKKFHTLSTKAGLTSDEKYLMIGAFGHESSREMTVSELLRACDMLDAKLNPKLAEIDLWRKRVMAAIGGWLRVMSVESNAAKIKAIACRASSFENFNDIPRERLNNLYYAFLKKQKDFKRVNSIVKEQIDELIYQN